MAVWLSILEIDVQETPLITWRAAMGDIACTAAGAHWVALGIVQNFYDFARAVPQQPGTPITSALQVSIHNTTMVMSRLAAQYELRGKPARLKIGLSGTAYSTFATHFTGRISNNLKITPQLATLDIQDGSTDSWREEIPNEITLADYPNLPKSAPEARQNIIIGNCTSDGKTGQGAVNCPYVDTVDHLYHVAKHRCKEISNVYVLGAVETLTFEVVERPSGETLLHFDHDIEPSAGNASGFTVTADVKGLYHDDTSPTGTMIVNPAEAIKEYSTRYMRAQTFNAAAYNVATVAYDDAITAGFVSAGVIDWYGDHESVIAAFQRSFAMEIFFNAAGEVVIHFGDVETGDPADPVFSSGQHILRGSMLMEKGAVANELQCHFDRDAVGGTWQNEPPVLVNLLSQAALDASLKEDLELPLTPDIETAEEVAKLRLYYGDEGRWLVTFDLSAPQLPGGLDLTGRCKVTHLAGIGAAGWTAEPLKILQMRYIHDRGVPRIRFTCLTLTPGSTAYLFRVPPINVTNPHVTESAEGYIVADWDVPASSPSAGPDPYALEIWYKRVEDGFNSKILKLAGRTLVSEAGTGYAFDAFYDESTDLDVYLRPIDINGVKRHLTAALPHVLHTTRTKIAALAGVTGIATGLSVTLDWSDLVAPAEIEMFKGFEVWRGTTAVFAAATRIASGIIVSTYTDTAFTSAGPFWYWVLSRTRYGVISLSSNTVGPFDMALPLAFVDVTVNGATFNGTLILPAGVTLDDVDDIEEAISDTAWAPGNTPDDNFPFSIGLNLSPSGTEAEKTYWVAFRLHFKGGFYGAWTYLMDGASPPNYKSVTSGTNAKLQGDNETNYWGAALDAANRIEYNQDTGVLTVPGTTGTGSLSNHDEFTAVGGETYIQLAALADLSKPLIVAYAGYGGTMGIIRRNVHYTASNASGFTRIVILDTESSPSSIHTFNAGDIADIWSTP